MSRDEDRLKRIVFIGSPLPNDMVDDYRTLSFSSADNIAQNVMIKGLSEHYGDMLTVVSELSRKYTGELILSGGIKSEVVRSVGVNRAVYYLSLMVGYIKKIKTILGNMEKAGEVILVTRGSYIFVAIPALYARLRYGAKWVPFIITTVEVPEYSFPYSIISKMSRWTSRRADGVITYVAQTARDYMPGKPFVEIVYSIDESLVTLYKESQDEILEKFTITYTGSLSSTYNFNYIIDAIIMTADKYRWVFAGTGVYADKIRELSEDSRYDVDYLGAVSNIEAVKLQKASHLLLCPRGGDGSPVNEYYSKYAASGKLIEYLFSGTPILASNVQSTLSRIRPFMTMETGQNGKMLIRDIEAIEEGYKDKVKLSHEGQRYAIENFTADNQNRKIYSFLENLS